MVHQIFLDTPLLGHKALQPMIDLLGRRWVLSILSTLRDGPVRGAQLSSRLTDVSEGGLIETLQDLERVGLVSRPGNDTVLLRTEYQLTPLGRSLDVPLAVISDWAGEGMPGVTSSRLGAQTR